MSENNLEEIRDYVLEKGFLELMGTEIKVDYTNLKNALVEHGRLSGDGFYIEVDYSLGKASGPVIQGGLAHEFAHITKDRTLRGWARFADWLLYRISKQYEKLDERNADVLAVTRGFGPQLLEFLEYSEENLDLDHYEDEGLSILELKALLHII